RRVVDLRQRRDGQQEVGDAAGEDEGQGEEQRGDGAVDEGGGEAHGLLLFDFWSFWDLALIGSALVAIAFNNFMALRRAEAGSRPGGRSTFLCFAKEKYPKERRPLLAATPALRCGATCVGAF